jgi:hypothetical protein
VLDALNVSGNAVIGSGVAASAVFVQINGAAGQFRTLQFRSGGVLRWAAYVGTGAESGSNAGSAFNLQAYTDAGASIDIPLNIVRASGGTITLGGSSARPVALTGALTVDGNTTLGNAATDLITLTGRALVRSVTDAGPMTATAGTQREIVFNTSDSKFYGCTVTGDPATWVALN